MQRTNLAETFIVETDCVDRNGWDSYVAAHPAAGNYHQYGWREVIEGSFGHRCLYLAARNNDNNIEGILPIVLMQSRIFGRFFVSLPFFNYGGILCDRREAGDALVARAASLQKESRAEYIELRHIEPFAMLPTKRHKVAMTLELAENPEALWRSFNAKLRNQIRKAEKSGLTATVGGSELLADFYRVFARNMRDLGTPVYSRKFFSRILARFPEHNHIIAVHLREKPVAAGLVCRFRDTMEIPWASSIREYNSLCPNNLLYWTALQLALSSGCGRFDFGRSTPGEGTFNFKKQWGAGPTTLHWQYLLPGGRGMPELNTKNPKFAWAIKVWRRLPLPITRLLGPRIVKSIP